MKSPPPEGVTVTCPQCGGLSLRRILSVPQIPTAALAAARKYPYASYRWANADLGGGCRESAEGHPIIESARHEREIMARTGKVRE